MNWPIQIFAVLALNCVAFTVSAQKVANSQDWIVDFEAGEGGYPSGPRMTLYSDGEYSVASQFPSKHFACRGTMGSGDLLEIDTRVREVFDVAPIEWDWSWEPDPECAPRSAPYRIALWPIPPNEHQPRMLWRDFDACKTRLIEEEWIELSRELREAGRAILRSCQAERTN